MRSCYLSYWQAPSKTSSHPRSSWPEPTLFVNNFERDISDLQSHENLIWDGFQVISIDTIDTPHKAQIQART
jgi:hypothetical protein